MSEIFSQADFEALSGPHVTRSWFLEMELPSEVVHFHTGTGRITLDGKEWRGVSDPVGGAIASISGIQEVRQGTAPSVSVSLSGANLEFVKSIHATKEEIEGQKARLYFATSDPETGQILISLKLMFDGYLSSPEISADGIGMRQVSVRIEGQNASMNFDPQGMWSAAGQRARYPGDKGLDFMGVEISEVLAE